MQLEEDLPSNTDVPIPDGRQQQRRTRPRSYAFAAASAKTAAGRHDLPKVKSGNS